MSTVRILHLEDSALDAELIHAELARNGLDVEFTRGRLFIGRVPS